MKVTITPSIPSGKIKAIASKSSAHRQLICAAFSDRSTEILCEETNADIDATVRCLVSLGAKITRKGASFIVLPIRTPNQNALCDCGESGSTLRFLIPVVSALGCGATFKMSGRLPQRPLSPLREELEAHGITFIKDGSLLTVSGKISAGEYTVRGDVSSQFITGLLLALSITEGESRLTVEGKIESLPYINMTLDALYDFSAEPERDEDGVFLIHGKKKLSSPEKLSTEGDWSNAAFALAAGAISGGAKVSLFNLDPESAQGDKAMIELLVRFGADVRRKGDCFSVRSGELYGIDIDASNIPDLVPILSVVAAAANGETRIYGAERLRIKESDRLATTSEMLSALGADVTEAQNGLIIRGGKQLSGGTVFSHNDHRIAMSASIAALICASPVTIEGAEAVAKSYPAFFDDLASLGVTLSKE